VHTGNRSGHWHNICDWHRWTMGAVSAIHS